MPYTYGTFKRLGLVERFKKSHFQRKHSVQFFSASGKGSAPFYFSETDPHERSTTWQVRRSEFDGLLLERAVELGVQFRHGVQVRDVIFEGEAGGRDPGAGRDRSRHGNSGAGGGGRDRAQCAPGQETGTSGSGAQPQEGLHLQSLSGAPGATPASTKGRP